MSDVFISYSRKDIAFARILNDMIQARGLESWIDWKDIPPSADWLAEVFEAIESADAFIFVISQTSITSEICTQEIAHAVLNHKRLLPIVVQEVDPKTAPKEVADLNWIFFREGQDDFQESFDILLHAVQTNLNWVKVHTRLQMRALEWRKHKGNASYLLRGHDLKDAELALTQAGMKRDPKPTDLQQQYLLASRKDADRRKRLTLGAITAGLVVAMVLSVVTFISQQKAMQQAQLSLSRQLARQAGSLLENNPSLSLLLSVEAYNAADTTEARNSLLSALQKGPQPVIFPSSHAGSISSIAYSADGKLLASAGDDITIILWDVTDPGAPHMVGSPLASHAEPIRSLAFHSNGMILASGSDDKTIILWDLSDLDHPKMIGVPLTAHTSALSCVAFSPDGKILASSGIDGSIILWDVAKPGSPSLLSTPVTYQSDVSSLAFSPDGKTLVTASTDTTLVLFDIADPGTPVLITTPFMGHTGPVRSVAFSPKGIVMASGSDDKTIILWDSKSILPTTASDPIFDLFYGDSGFLAPNQIGTPLVGQDSPIVSLAFSPDGNTLASGSQNKTIILWDVSDPANPLKIGAPLIGHKGSVSSLAFSPDGTILTSSDSEGAILSWSFTNTGSMLAIGAPLTGHAGPVLSIAFSQQDRMLVSVGETGSILQWDFSNINHPGLMDAYPSSVTSNDGQNRYALNNDGDHLASANDQIIALWDINDPAAPSRIGPEFLAGGSVSGIAFSSDNQILALGMEDAIALWNISDPASPQKIGLPFTTSATYISNLAISSDNKTLALGVCGHTSQTSNVCTQGEITLWDISAPEAPDQINSFMTDQAGYVSSLAFSADGKFLASGSDDRTIALWDISSLAAPDLLGLLRSNQIRLVSSLAFSSESKILIAGDDEGTLYLWDVAPESWAKMACQKAGRNLTLSEWVTYFPVQKYHLTCLQWPAAKD